MPPRERPIVSQSVQDQILACLPQLRAFARSLARDRDAADDLVQDAIVRAITSASQFTPGTNFKAWMFTITRNRYFSTFRQKSLTRPLTPVDLETHGTAPTQQAGLEFEEFRQAFNRLPAEQREALTLIGADGFRYEEAAAIAGCALGTMKSRVFRARRELESKLGRDRIDNQGHDFGSRSPVEHKLGGTVGRVDRSVP